MAQDYTLTQTGPQLQALVDAILPPFETTIPVSGMKPNVVYSLGELAASTDFALAQATDPTIINHYYWIFDTPADISQMSFTFSNLITDWMGGSAPTISGGKHYEFSVIDGVATFMEI